MTPSVCPPMSYAVYLINAIFRAVMSEHQATGLPLCRNLNSQVMHFPPLYNLFDTIFLIIVKNKGYLKPSAIYKDWWHIQGLYSVKSLENHNFSHYVFKSRNLLTLCLLPEKSDQVFHLHNHSCKTKIFNSHWNYLVIMFLCLLVSKLARIKQHKQHNQNMQSKLLWIAV